MAISTRVQNVTEVFVDFNIDRMYKSEKNHFLSVISAFTCDEPYNSERLRYNLIVRFDPNQVALASKWAHSYLSTKKVAKGNDGIRSGRTEVR